MRLPTTFRGKFNTIKGEEYTNGRRDLQSSTYNHEQPDDTPNIEHYMRRGNISNRQKFGFKHNERDQDPQDINGEEVQVKVRGG